MDTGESDPFPPGEAGDEDGLFDPYNTSPGGAFAAELVPRVGGAGLRAGRDGHRLRLHQLERRRHLPRRGLRAEARRITGAANLAYFRAYADGYQGW